MFESFFRTMFEKVSKLLDCLTILFREYVAVDNDGSKAPTLTKYEPIVVVYNPNISTYLYDKDKSHNAINNAVLLPSAS